MDLVKFAPGSNKLYGVIHNYVLKGFPLITLYPSSSCSSQYPVSAILEADNQDSHWASNVIDESVNNEYVIFTLKEVKLKITHYSIRSHKVRDCAMTGWELYGSKDNQTYELLHYKNQTNELFWSGIGQYEVDAHRNAYQSFKIKQTLMSTEGSCGLQMRVSGFELFGSLVPLSYNFCTSRNQCKYSASSHILFLVYLISIK